MIRKNVPLLVYIQVQHELKIAPLVSNSARTFQFESVFAEMGEL